MKKKILEKIEHHQGLADRAKADYDFIGVLGSESDRRLCWTCYRSNEAVVQALKELLEDE